MEFGVHLPHLGRNVGRDSLTHFALSLERAGFASAWVSDHVCWPADIASAYPYTDDGSFGPDTNMGWLDPIGTQLFVAGITERIRLGFSVLILPYRQPVTTAKQLATLDVLSDGRLILGCGVGWMKEEAQILGMPWDNRGKRSDEQLALFHALFTQAQPSYSGQYYQVPEVGFEPKPLQNPLPIWVGGSTSAAFRRAGELGTGFHAAFQSSAVVADEWRQVCKYATQAGRDPGDLTLSLRVYLDPAQAMEPDKSVAGSVGQMQDRVGELADLGVTHLVLDPVARGGVQGRLDSVLAFAQAVMPGFSA